MAWQTSSSRSPAEGAASVEAATLKEALRLARQKFGADVHVIRSRTVNRRQPGGLGQKKSVEVLVQTAGGYGRRSNVARPAEAYSSGGARLTDEIAEEVDRIEQLVRRIAAQQASCEGLHRCRQNPVAEALVASGADPGLVVRICERCQVETGAGPDDHQALLSYLRRSLPTVRATWLDMAGAHVFLGPSGSGRSDMVYRLAAKLSAMQQQVLVLSILPRHPGEIRRLQAAAAESGFDAAVIEKVKQLDAAGDHVAEYDVVLLDAPAFGAHAGQQEAELQRFIIQHPSCHRHLVFPMDRDLLDSRGIIDSARQWNCDWLALSRLDQTPRRGKLLDLLDQLPLPVSLVNDAVRPFAAPHLASADHLLDLMLAPAGYRSAADG